MFDIVSDEVELVGWEVSGVLEFPVVAVFGGDVGTGIAAAHSDDPIPFEFWKFIEANAFVVRNFDAKFGHCGDGFWVDFA